MIIFAQSWATPLAAGESRIALLIGNGAYADAGRLENPVNDVALMARTLRELGFETVELADADLAAMKRAIQDFVQRLEAAGRDTVGLFYYAGHGVHVNGTNYLLPLRAQIARKPDVENEAVKLEWVLAEMKRARNRLNILILDVSRDNPLSGEQGLRSIDAPPGTLIAYANAPAPGSVAYDGMGPNSPYTEALVERIQEPGLPVERAFSAVRGRVQAATGGLQVPWATSSLTEAFYFNPGAEPQPEEPSSAELAGLHEPEAAAVSALDHALQQMVEGRVAFNTPERMMLRDVVGVHAVLDVRMAEEELKQLLLERGPAETAVLRVADVMSAELSGIAFEISPSGRQEQPISFSEPTDWRWQVKAIQEGTHPLHLRFFAVVNVDGTDRTRHIETLNRAIVVDVTGWDKAKRMVAEANWLWASVLLPLAGAFAWWRRRRQVRPPAA